MSLLDRQLLFVTGKGGTGKTTVAAALALAASRRGRRTIVCEVGDQARVPRLLGGEPGGPGEERHVNDCLSVVTLSPWRVLEEFIGRILQSKSLTHLLVRTNFFRTFAEAAPGGMELGAMVKIWELAQEKRWNRHAEHYDLVIVDAPATGHALGMLRTPGTFADIARVGPIATQSRRVREFIADPARTGFLAVALPGELPVSETFQLAERLRSSLGRDLERVVVNGVLPDRFGDAEIDALRAAARGRENGHLRATLAQVRGADARADEQRLQIARLREGVGAPVDELPFVFAPRLGPDELAPLADRLASA